jgi:hypothetical protein
MSQELMPLLASKTRPITLRQVVDRATKSAFVSRLPIILAKLAGRTSKQDLFIASVLGALGNLAFISLLLFVDYPAALATLGVKLKPAETSNIATRLSVVTLKLLIDFVIQMGAAYSEIQKEEKAEEERKKAEARHQEMIALLNHCRRDYLDADVEAITLDFKQQMFREYRAVILEELSNVIIRKTDATFLYDPKDHVTPREMQQAPLDEELGRLMIMPSI